MSRAWADVDPRRSRRPKLDDMNPGHLLLIARESVLFPSPNLSRDGLCAVLRSAAIRGNEEALFLHKVVSDPKSGSFEWLCDALADDVSSVGQFYRGHALLRCSRDEEGLVVLRKLAEDDGYAPAMCGLALGIGGDSPAECQSWMQRGAELCDPDGLAYWGRFVENRELKISLYEQSAALGSLQGLMALTSVTTDEVVRAALWARQALLSHNRFAGARDLLTCVKRLQDGLTLSRLEVNVLYVAGRELEGFEEFWEEGCNRNDELVCIGMYLTVTHRARRAALQTVVALRELGRDVAVLIAQRVFRTREEHLLAWLRGWPDSRKKNE